jgi:tetratricopeptide (TPR) repeat protein
MNQQGIGAAANSDVRAFLECLAKLCPEQGKENFASNTVVVLTTRLVPKELALTGAEFYSVARMTTEDARKLVRLPNDPNQTFQDEWSALVSLLGGHRYAMALASAWITNESRQTDPKRMQELIRLLADVGPLRRVEHMIALTLRRLDGDEYGDKHPGVGPHQLMMKRLAVFMGAIRRDTSFKYCYELSKREWDSSEDHGDELGFPDDAGKQVWETFVNNELLFELKPEAKDGQPEQEANRCVMHAIVREYVFHHMHEADARKLSSLTQTGFTSGVSMVDPGKQGAKIVEELFLELRGKCRDNFDDVRNANLRGLNQDERTKQFQSAQELCQDAFGVLRSRMLANTVARWGSYKDYIHYLVRMVDLTRAYCGKRQNSDTLFWSRCDPALSITLSSAVIHSSGPLFGDELAWLYHELGLALYHEGAMIDCVSVWEQGLVVNRFLDGDQPGQYTFQAYCNLGAACIQWGRLPSAQEYLRRAKEISLRIEEKDHVPRLDAYLALIRHLRGDLLLADEEYKDAIEGLKATGNTRAECIFQRHWADLKLKMKDRDSAEKFIRSCRAKAEEGHFPDVVAHARLSEGHMHRTRKQYKDAIREYTIALRAATEHGMRGLEADVHCEMGRLALDLGDVETARARAIKSLQIANELHLGLRQTHGLVVLGKATVGAGQRQLGVEYLKLAKDLAAQQHYELREREAEEELHRLGAVD